MKERVTDPRGLDGGRSSTTSTGMSNKSRVITSVGTCRLMGDNDRTLVSLPGAYGIIEGREIGNIYSDGINLLNRGYAPLYVAERESFNTNSNGPAKFYTGGMYFVSVIGTQKEAPITDGSSFFASVNSMRREYYINDEKVHEVTQTRSQMTRIPEFPPIVYSFPTFTDQFDMRVPYSVTNPAEFSIYITVDFANRSPSASDYDSSDQRFAFSCEWVAVR